MALWTAIALPPLAVLTIGGVELASIGSDRSELQDAADAAALMSARELGFAGPGGVVERAQSYALANAADVARRQTLTASATLDDENRAVTVRIQANRGSFFGNLLPPGGFNTTVHSIASALGDTPLCVVGMRTTSGTNIHMYDSARIESPGCLIQSNRDVQVDSSARINAGEVQVTGNAQGGTRISPTALTGAPVLPDPFVARTMTFPALCNSSDLLGDILGSQTLQPGMHCGDINVKQNATLTLAPGVHYFRNSDLKIEKNGRIVGDGVVLIFDDASSMMIKDQGTLDLQGIRNGSWAGFVIVGPRSQGEDFVFESDNINRLEGVIYMPSSLLKVSGAAQIAEGSNWTVTLASRIEVRGSTQLVINVNYGASTVPVPAGVGNSGQGTRISR